MSTIKDVAKKAGVSISTVSYAMNDKPNVNPETKEKILAIAKELNYTPNVVAKQLKTNETKNIGIFISHLSLQQLDYFVTSAKRVFEQETYNVIISNGKSASQLMLNRYVDAAIIMDDQLSNETISQFASYGSPVYLYDRNIPGTNIISNELKEDEIIENLIEEMYEKGYRSFAFLSGLKDSSQHRLRYKGFKKALSQLRIEEHLFIEGKGTIESGYKIGKEIKLLKELPDFLFCSNDLMAYGLIQALKEQNLKIPNDIAICGFDNDLFCQHVKPSLSSIGIDYVKLGQEAAENILDVILRKKFRKPTHHPYIIYLRESC